jgi:hypothetical protein
MTISVSTSGTNRTVTLEYTANSVKIDTTLDRAARYMYIYKSKYQQYSNDNLVKYDNLTTQQKLNIIDSMIKDCVLLAAKNCHVNDNVTEANTTAILETETDHSLG